MGNEKTELVADNHLIRQKDEELEKLRKIIRIHKMMGDTLELEIDTEDELELLDDTPADDNDSCWSRTKKLLKDLKTETLKVISVLF